MEELGEPPGYYDWTPVDRARAAGARVDGAERWEREHPRWPSPAVVVRHWGSWRALRAACDLPGPPPIELSFAERVGEALRLRADGLTWAQVGETLGISPDTARRYVHARPCSQCGQSLVLNSDVCHSCLSRYRTRWGQPFTQDEIVAAIQRWEQLERRAPAQVDWQPADQGGHPRWEAECPQYPPSALVSKRYGSWNRALNAAGFDRPRPRSWTGEEIVAELRAWAKEHGQAPTSSEWDRPPDRDRITVRFGSWPAALEAAGLTPRVCRRRWTDEEVLDGLRRWALELGRRPHMADRVGPLGKYPSPSIAVKRFGSWSAALRAAGLSS